MISHILKMKKIELYMKELLKKSMNIHMNMLFQDIRELRRKRLY